MDAYVCSCSNTELSATCCNTVTAKNTNIKICSSIIVPVVLWVCNLVCHNGTSYAGDVRE